MFNNIPKEMQRVQYVKVYSDIITKMHTAGWTLSEIKDYFLDLGIDIFEEEKNYSNNIRLFKKINDKIDKLICNLRTEGKSYRYIVYCLQTRGIQLSHETVRNICKNLPKIEKIKRKRSNKAKKTEKKISKKAFIKELDIYNLRKAGYTYEEISKYYKNEVGINVHPTTISKKSKIIFRKMNEKEPSIRHGYKRDIRRIKSKTDLQSMVYEIAKRRNANQKQLEQFMDEVSNMYKIDLKSDIREEDKER